jgi:hypothetical protein
LQGFSQFDTCDFIVIGDDKKQRLSSATTMSKGHTAIHGPALVYITWRHSNHLTQSANSLSNVSRCSLVQKSMQQRSRIARDGE